ncbi:GGDEF domain-containing protein, partial [Vibrio fluvialis]
WLSENAVGGVAILQAQFIKELYEEKGYEAGDGMVRDLAAQLKATVTTPNATLARISTDEFGLILPNLDESELRLVADGLINA